MSPIDPTSPIRQRWRITFACGLRDASDGRPRDLADAWSEALAGTALDGGSGLPFVTVNGRPRIVLAMPLPDSMAAERDLLDVFLTDRIPVGSVRRAIESSVPSGCTVTDLHDVWVGEPALPGQVIGADYRIDLGVEPASAAGSLATAAAGLMAAATLPRTRAKGGSSKAYDLRPLVARLAVIDVGPPTALRVRTVVDPSRGGGRPDEVVAALAEHAGVRLSIAQATRERILLAGDDEHAGG